MPLGEIVGEFILKPILEVIAHVVFYTVWFWTGFIFLELVSFGKLNLATPDRFGERNKHPKKKNKKKEKRRWLDCSLWLHKGKGSKCELKPETTACVGMLLWFLVIVGFLLLR